GASSWECHYNLHLGHHLGGRRVVDQLGEGGDMRRIAADYPCPQDLGSQGCGSRQGGDHDKGGKNAGFNHLKSPERERKIVDRGIVGAHESVYTLKSVLAAKSNFECSSRKR